MQQNNPQMQAISQAVNLWRNVAPDKREEHIKNLYKSQNKNYEEEKAKVIEALRNRNPQLLRMINVFQQLGIRI